jgi:hypothetical protein
LFFHPRHRFSGGASEKREGRKDVKDDKEGWKEGRNIKEGRKEGKISGLKCIKEEKKGGKMLREEGTTDQPGRAN